MNYIYFLECETVFIFTITQRFIMNKVCAFFVSVLLHVPLAFVFIRTVVKTVTEIPPSHPHSVFVSFSLATRSWSSRHSQTPMLLLSFPVVWRLHRCLLGSRTYATPSPKSSVKLHVDRLNIWIWRMYIHTEHMEVTDQLGLGNYFFVLVIV